MLRPIIGDQAADELSDAETTDSFYYTVFPNFHPWGAYNASSTASGPTRTSTRCASWSASSSRRTTGERPPPAPIHWLGETRLDRRARARHDGAGLQPGLVQPAARAERTARDPLRVPHVRELSGEQDPALSQQTHVFRRRRRLVGQLDGRQVLVTGANRGIGAAFVTAALDRGAERVFAGVRDVASLAGAQQQHGHRLVPVQLDVTDPEQVDAAAGLCADVDLLVCNAGQTAMLGVLQAAEEDTFRALLEVNFFGPLASDPPVHTRPRAAAGRHRVCAVYRSDCALPQRPDLQREQGGCPDDVARGPRGARERGVSLTNVFPGYVATDMSAKMTLPMASPGQVAARSLDGWLAGVASVFPDRYAELVAQTVDEQALTLLDSPRAVMNQLVSTFSADSLAGT